MTTSPELQKLAHTLGVVPDRLAMLAPIPAQDLRTLRAQIGEALFQADRAQFAKVAALSKAIPTAVAAKLTQFALPPFLAARTAELLEPHKAVDLVARIPDAYLADVAAKMDPERAAEVIRQIPAARVAKVAAELARRSEWIVIGSFVSHVNMPALAASVQQFNPEQLLRISFVLHDLNRLDAIAAELDTAQVDGMLAAAADHSLWAELDQMIGNLNADNIARLAERYAAAPESVIAATKAAVKSKTFGKRSLARLDGA
ncbi:MAG: hypothetical protein ABI232_06520 [Jatrophihabitantaceae bacterium]